MTPLAPRLSTYSAFDSSETTAMALAPEAATSCTPNTPRPPEAPHTSTLSPGLSVCGEWPNNMRQASTPLCSSEAYDVARTRQRGPGCRRPPGGHVPG